MKFLVESEVTFSGPSMLTYLAVSPSSLSMHLWPKGILRVTGHCLTGATAKRGRNRKFP